MIDRQIGRRGLPRPAGFCVAAALALSIGPLSWAAAAGDPPKVHDGRLRLTLVAQDPQIVTPIGLAIDAADRLFVLESHTHDRPADYDGPASDRVKTFRDRDGDGVFEEVRVFAEGIRTGLNLAFSPDGVLHVVCAREVWALPDSDGDGRCDAMRRVLRLETEERYSHNCLLGITFDRQGRMYVARGNTGSRAYRLVGTDGSSASGYGDGGGIARCDADGSNVRSFATGFWNPFSIKFDHAGRLLCVDNDPDARGPNRLVHVVEGGDYGYRSIYGGGGNHPFQGWDGDLPGTLPYISGTGEAPCDLIDCLRTSLPSDYAGSLLVTVWNENTIERHATSPRGASLAAETSILVSGGDDFRPVAIEADSRGNLYFTDWVRVAYPIHGRGRIWRLSAAPGETALTPRSLFAAPQPAAGSPALAATAAARDMPAIRRALRSGDPFLHHAAVMALSRSSLAAALPSLAADPDAGVRLGCLLAARRAGLDEPTAVRLARRFLADHDPRVRRAALVWAGTGAMLSLRDELDQALQAADVSPLLLETYLAAMETLDARYIRAVAERAESKSSQIPRHSDNELVLRLAADPSRPAEVRAIAIARIAAPLSDDARRQLLSWAAGAQPAVQLAAVRRLSGDPTTETLHALTALASDAKQPATVRAESLLSLARHQDLDPAAIIPLIDDRDPVVAVEAARTLRFVRDDPRVIAAAARRLRAIDGDKGGGYRNGVGGEENETPLAEQLRFLLRLPQPDRPATPDAWWPVLATGGDPSAGRRVFHSVHATCASCHSTDRTAATLGPDLSGIGQSVDRRQIVASILRPSDQFPPQYQAWTVLTTGGQTHVGLQLDHKAGGAIELYTTAGKTVRLEADEIEQYQASRTSLMPDGLEANLTVSEFRDLVAYLESLR